MSTWQTVLKGKSPWKHPTMCYALSRPELTDSTFALPGEDRTPRAAGMRCGLDDGVLGSGESSSRMRHEA